MAPETQVPVLYEHFEIGAISVSSSGQLGFSYNPHWINTKGGFPLSVTMPLSDVRYGDHIITPWLANLLPEEQQLLTLSRTLGISSTDTLAILMVIGGDTAGAISIDKPSIQEEWDYQPLTDYYDQPTEADALKRHFDDLRNRPFLAGADGIRLSLAGGQQKTPLSVIGPNGLPKLGMPDEGDTLAIPMNGAPSTIIIKPNNPTLAGIVENETYCLTLAGLIGIPVAEVGIIKTTGQTALGVVRYDRVLRKNEWVRRLHQEDLAQANGIFPSHKYEQGTVRGLDLTTPIHTGRHLPAAEALNLLDQVIFNILVANTDAHAKNYSMILSGGPTLAPLYDVSTVLLWDHVNQYHAQKLAGRKRKPEDMARRHWDRIAEDAGLSPRGVRLRVQELVDTMVVARVEATAIVSGQQGAVTEIVELVAALIEENALRIAGRLGTVDGSSTSQVITPH